MTVLKVQDLGKSFREYQSEWHRFARWFGWSDATFSEHWILRHINLEIAAGETIGIIGQNGAGKSTLLKLITGTLKASEGSVHTTGRISAILELGMGFKAELTGRENAAHAAGLMGFNASQIAETMPDIEAFAEIGKYFDEPVRTYSSGMQMRVAFAVATAWRPDLLIVDEALSVGDAYFSHKCFHRISFFQESGTSLLIVSHDHRSILGLCSRAILLEKGRVSRDGVPEEVLDFYNATIAEKETSTIRITRLDDGKLQTSSGTGEACIESILLYNSKMEPCDHISVGEQVEIHINVKVEKELEKLVLGYGIKDRLGQVMYGTNTFLTNQVIFDAEAGSRYSFVIAFPANLGVGTYSVQTALVDSETHMSANYEWRDLALVFKVLNTSKTKFVGCLWNEPVISVEKI